ncbi:aromatic acid/H+ symport family MFS transporter [Streptomyces lacrimifluminis]|uniref:MFS transporter n=1 Tax=Streptomyces lacrimifluminis TaxID=1500077 RepID=A0A917P2V7_9ACTN|nr:MFS transporter [Streptomyces lacrimifluminis]GGJ57740.1 MFS transporter [Streptomyces lacrimifluminis]
MTTTHGRPKDATAEGGVGTTSRRVVVLAFLTIFLDGFDTASLGFVVPTLAREWNLDESAFTPALVATNLGVVIGYLCSSRAAARFGRKPLIVTGTVVFAAGSALTVPVDSVTMLGVARLVTALGLGAVLPACVSLTADNVPPARRASASVGVVLAIAVGAVAGGIVSTPLITAFGWTSVFWAGAVLPALLVPLLVRGLPGTPASSAASAPRAEAADPSVRRLFEQGTAVQTVLLWCFALLMYTTNYGLLTWLPTLLARGYGFTPEQAPVGTSMIAVGGVIGGLVMVPLCSRIGTPRALTVMALVAVVFLVATAWADTGRAALLVMLAAAGAGIVAGVLGQTALAVTLYPTAARTTGVAYAAALGRTGSIVGPAVGGGLLALDVPGREILLLSAVPPALGAVVAFVFVVRARSTAVRDRS